MKYSLKYDKAEKRFLILVIVYFIILTVAGSLLHELGHYLTARYFGHPAIVHYNATSLIFQQNTLAGYQRILITAGGPVQTMLTGTIGFFLLLNYWGKKRTATFTGLRIWTAIGMTLFWLRQPFLLFAWLLKISIGQPVGGRGDEIRIARYLNWPDSSLLIITGLIGFIILLILIFSVIPASMRRNFIVAGFIGSAIGYIGWMYWLGPLILP